MPPQRSGFPGLELIRDEQVKNALRLIWDQLHLTNRQPIVGTLNPDQRPILGQQQTGQLFLASDFRREYVWNGTGWQDVLGAPERRRISFFNGIPSPQTGWLRCDGSQGSISTADGRTEFYKAPIVPDLNGQHAWVRL